MVWLFARFSFGSITTHPQPQQIGSLPSPSPTQPPRDHRPPLTGIAFCETWLCPTSPPPLPPTRILTSSFCAALFPPSVVFFFQLSRRLTFTGEPHFLKPSFVRSLARPSVCDKTTSFSSFLGSRICLLPFQGLHASWGGGIILSCHPHPSPLLYGRCLQSLAPYTQQ